MIESIVGMQIFLKPGNTDMRKSINGLCGIVQEKFQMDPYAKCLFAFCNRKRAIIKILYWERNGFCLWQKRLEKDRFPWPKDESEAMEITRQKFDWLLRGIDFTRAHEEIKISRVQ